MAPQEDSPGIEKPEAYWTIFVGNLHPNVTETDLYELFDGRDNSKNAIIRTSRGCGVTPIPEKDVGPRDRCYASIEVRGFNRIKKFMDEHRKNPLVLYGLPLALGHSAADMPEFSEILQRARGSVPGETECTGGSIPRRRLAIQKTLGDIEAEEEPRS